MFSLYFLAGLLVFATLFLAIDFMSMAPRYSGVALDVWLRYYLYTTPAIVYQMIPVGGLIATVFTLSSMNRANELIALHSSGMSLARISSPILVLTLSLSIFSLWMSDRILPQLTQKKNFTLYVEIQQRPGLYSTVTTDRIWYRSENILFNIQTLNTEESRAQGLTLYYFDPDWRLIQLITASRVQMQGQRWDLERGTVTLFTEASSFPLTQSFDRKTIAIGEEVSDIKSMSSASEVMSLRDLRRFIARNKDAGLETLSYEVDYHSKFGFALAGFVMALMGIPFSVSRQRSGGAFVNLSLCVGLAFLYWAFYSSSLALGRHGLLPPILAAWVANGLLLGISFVLLLRLRS